MVHWLQPEATVIGPNYVGGTSCDPTNPHHTDKSNDFDVVAKYEFAGPSSRFDFVSCWLIKHAKAFHGSSRFPNGRTS